MEKPDRESQDLPELEGEETIELAVPPSTNATQLLRFRFWLEETCHRDCHSAGIIRTVGSFYQGNLITISLGGSSPADILNKISGMPDVEKVEERPLARRAVSRFATRFAGLRSLIRIAPSNRFLVTLKETSITSQELATV